MGVNDYIVRPVDPNELLARPHTDQAQALYRLFAHAAGGDCRDGDPRSAHGPAQSPLHDQPLEDVVRGVLATRQAALGPVARHRLFKAVNDSYSHDAGDSVLREFAARVRRNIRGIDLAWRLGGEEFVVVMPDTDIAKAYLVGERLRQCIAAAPFYAGERIGTLEVTASVGVAALEFPDETRQSSSRSAPTRRSIAPNGTVATGLWPTRPDSLVNGSLTNHSG